jgi:transcription elongation factor Elf1
MNNRKEGVVAVIVAPPQEARLEVFCGICGQRLAAQVRNPEPSPLSRAVGVYVEPCDCKERRNAR